MQLILPRSVLAQSPNLDFRNSIFDNLDIANHEIKLSGFSVNKSAWKNLILRNPLINPPEKLQTMNLLLFKRKNLNAKLSVKIFQYHWFQMGIISFHNNWP